ncbi:MAG TPA: zinc ribbon domain-containing protein, partial [Candidatus Thalassarchaeaceae archaeon]
MGSAVAMQCGSCAEEIPSDSLFCPECGARQTPGVVSGTGLNSANAPAPNSAPDSANLPPITPMQQPGQMGNPIGGSIAPTIDPNIVPQNTANVASDPEVISTSFLSSLAAEIEGGNAAPQPSPSAQEVRSTSDMVVDAMVEADREKKANARSAWLSMNQQSASDFLNAVGAVQNSASVDRGTRSLDESEPIVAPRPRSPSSSSSLPNEQLVRRMVEVAVRRVGRKRGVGTESPQVKVEGSSVRANVTYIDDGRVLDNPPELHSAFEHAIDTEIRLKGYDVVLDVSLFRSKDGTVEFAWGYQPESAVSSTDDEELFECGACGGLVRDSDPSCPTCGAEFEDDDADPEPAPARSAPPSGPRGPSRGGPSSGPKGPSRGGPPSG